MLLVYKCKKSHAQHIDKHKFYSLFFSVYARAGDQGFIRATVQPAEKDNGAYWV